MYNTIEEKLSAIKAINSQKEMVEGLLEAMIKVPEKAVSIQLRSDLEHVLPTDRIGQVQQRIDNTLTDINQIIVDGLYEQRDQLIEKAKELMK